jgi:RNA polymerase sigma-70 factor (ECF subfamily)
MTPSIANENFLLQEIINGDSQSFRKLYEAYYMQVFLFATRLIKSKSSAEDIVQQAFIKVWETRDRIDISKNFKSYLLTITRNLIIDSLKKTSRDKALIEKMFLNMKAFEENSYSLLLQKEITRLHQEAINNLPRQRKIVYKLSREGELNYEEIASLLGISKNTVRNQISDASKSVRDYVRKHSDIAYVIILIIY